MKLTLDVENTVTKRDGKMHLDPFEPTNKLVMVGCLTDTGKEYLFRDNFDGVQKLLDDATILIGHNIAYDLMWLWECGFNYDGAVFDTMLAEYVLQRGIKQPLSLEACALRYDLDTKKQDTLKEYFKKDMGVDEIPPEELSSYLSADLHATQQLSDCLYKKLNTVEYAGLMESVLLSNRVSTVLARIYQRGFSVDLSKLEEVRVEFQNEKQETEKRLQSQVNKLMGDTSINLNSPEQMSWVIYSRKPRDKSTWCNNFTPYMNKADFTHGLNSYSDIVYKTTAISCNPCYGTGYLKKVKKDGTPYLKHPKCDACSGSGYYFKPSDKVAGFKFNPPTAKWVTANGFSVNKNMLAVLQNSAKKSNQTEALQFLTDLQRVSALDTYLSSFVEGISTYVKPDNKLHVRLLQHRTSTGRFSGAEPNMHRMRLLLKKYLQGLTYMHIRLRLLVMQVRLRLDKKLKHIRLLRYMEQQGMEEARQKQNTMNTLQKSTKVSKHGTPDWLQKL